MNIDKNLQTLRKEAGLSQESFAEKINVTRQTIYKWEQGITTPDIDKINEIAEYFNVSVETLMNGDIECEKISKEDIYHKFLRFSFSISISIGFIIFSFALILLLFKLNVNEDLAIVAMLSVIFLAILVIIFSGLGLESFKKINPDAKFYPTKKEIIKERGIFIKKVVSGIAFIFAGVIILIFMSSYDAGKYEDVGTVILFFTVGIGVIILVQGGIIHGLYEEPKEEISVEAKKKSSLVERICGIIMLLSTIVFLVWLIAFEGAKFAWLSFAVGGILCAIVAIAIPSKEE